MPTLEQLTLHSRYQVGLWPKLDLTRTHFPRLKSLMLRNLTFFEDAQLDWILSHAATLRELHLDDCTIIWAVMCCAEEYHDPFTVESHEGDYSEDRSRIYRTYPKRWHDYFSSFRTGLPLLHSFQFERISFPGPRQRRRDIKLDRFQENYHVFDHRLWANFRPYEWDKELDGIPTCFEEDKEALLSLLREIEQKYPARTED